MAGGDALPAQIWTFLGPIWVWAGLAGTPQRRLRWTAGRLVWGVAATAARILQRGDEGFTSPSRAWPGLSGPSARGRKNGFTGELEPARAGRGHGPLLHLPFPPVDLVAVAWFALGLPLLLRPGGGGCPLLRGRCCCRPSFSVAFSVLAGLASFATVKRRWELHNRGGACWWAACLVAHDGSSGVVGGWWSGEIRVGLSGTDAVTSVGAAVPS